MEAGNSGEKEALFYEKLQNKKVRCKLCPRLCFISENSRGLCGVRKNIGGKLYSLVYEKPCSLAIDPIEKKPLFHFLPGTRALSIATCGCNFACKFCQNHAISKGEIFGEPMTAKEVVEIAKKNRVESIAYTYTEPTVFFEYAFEIMKLAKKAGIRNVWVSNGYTNKEAITKMAPFLDAVNIDIKGDEEVYATLCFASLKPVLEALLEYKKHKIWIEITCLIIPKFNDSDEWMERNSKWIMENLGKETPLHLSRFFPHYQMLDTEPTPISTLKRLYKVARKNLDYVYIGNVFDTDYESTFCPNCGEIIIGREGYEVDYRGSRCKKCNAEIAGVFC